MLDFADVLAAKLRDKGYTDARPGKIANLKGGGIAVRRIPSTITANYYNGPREIAYLVQVAVARESEAQAIEECDAILALAPFLDLRSANGSYEFTSCEPYTDTQELEIPGYPYVYECRLRAIITTTTGRI